MNSPQLRDKKNSRVRIGDTQIPFPDDLKQEVSDIKAKLGYRSEFDVIIQATRYGTMIMQRVSDAALTMCNDRVIFLTKPEQES